MTEGVQLTSGEVRSADAILQASSFDLFQGELHVAVSAQLAASFKTVDEGLHRVLHNLIFLKSAEARALTALCSFVQAYPTQIAAIYLSSRSEQVLRAVVGGKHRIERITAPRRPLVTRRHVGLYLAKALMHRAFRLGSRGAERARVIVRAWVEVSLTLYPEQSRSGLVLVYPFALNWWRQVRFVRHLRAQGYRYRWMGVPYRILPVLRNLAVGMDPALTIAEAELEANARHASELAALAPDSILTSDEFEVAADALYSSLLRSGVQVTNTAHGVGQYSPWISYSHFRVFTETQLSFYVARNPRVRYSVVPQLGRPVFMPSFDECVDAPLRLVLVHQPFESSPLEAEAEAQFVLDAALAELAVAWSVDYALLHHPNKRRPNRRWRRRSFLGRAVSSWSGLSPARHIFLTINSTAFFDLRGAGAVIVYRGPTFDPSMYFPSPFLGCDIDALPSLLSILRDPKAWKQAAALHAGSANIEPDDQLRRYLW